MWRGLYNCQSWILGLYMSEGLLVITAQSVNGGLVIRSGLLDDDVGVTGGRLVGGSGSAAILASAGTAKATATTEEDGRLVVEDLLASLSVDSGDATLGDGGLALVDNLEETPPRDEVRARGDRELSDLEILLTVKKHHGREVGHDGAEIKRHLGVEGRNHTECGNDLEVIGTLAVMC